MARSESLSVRINAALRKRDHRGAAELANANNQPDLALSIYRRMGFRKEAATILLRKGRPDEAIDMLMNGGMWTSAQRLAWEVMDMERVCRVADRALEASNRNLEFTPQMVKMLLKAREAAGQLQMVYGLCGLHHGIGNHAMERARAGSDAMRYNKMAEILSRDGIGHFRKVGDFYHAVIIGIRMKEYGVVVDLIREGLGYQERIGCYNGDFLNEAEKIVGGYEHGYGLEDRWELFERIAAQRSSMLTKKSPFT